MFFFFHFQTGSETDNPPSGNRATVGVSNSDAYSTFLADSPDNALRYQYWDVEYARPYSDACHELETGFRDDARAQFRWVRREPADPSERPDLRLVPLFPRQLLGPVAAWDAQDEGKT